jgi:hypothetical protein
MRTTQKEKLRKPLVFCIGCIKKIQIYSLYARRVLDNFPLHAVQFSVRISRCMISQLEKSAKTL